MNAKQENKAVYLDHKGWFWVVWEGQRALYFGPYRDQQEAERKGPEADRADQIPDTEKKRRLAEGW